MKKIIKKLNIFKRGPAQPHFYKSGAGFVILFAVTISAILLAIALGIANIALKEVKFGTSAKGTNNAFFAADTGIERALFNDKTAGYSTGITTSFFVSELGSTGQSCAKVTVDKTAPSTVTIISKGYDTGGNVFGSCNPPLNNVERELLVTYGGPSSSCPPASWTAQDIGSVGIVGSSCGNSGVFTVIGSGDDIWGISDAFHYAYQSATGNIQIIARVITVQNTDPWAKVGIMIREDLTNNSRHVMIVATPANGYAMQQRATTGGSSENVSASGSAPVWLKLVRIGNTFTGYTSANGTAWNLVTTFTNTMASSFKIGLAVTSHNNTLSNTSTFDNVSVSTP